MRCLRGARRRSGRRVVHSAGRSSRGARGGHDRGDLEQRLDRPSGSIRRRGRPPVRVLHAGPDRCGDRAARGDAQAVERADPGGDERQPLSLRRLPEDRASHPPSSRERVMTHRLVKATSEMEGRITEVWTLVDDEDELEQWPANGDETLVAVGRPAARQDGPVRAAGRATYTVDIRPPGVPHAALLRSPVAHARVKSLDLDAAQASAGVRAVIGPESTLAYTPTLCPAFPIVTSEPVYAGQPIALVAADTPEQARAALEAMKLELEVLPHVVDTQEAMGDMRIHGDPMEQVRGDPEAALKAADVTVEVEVETPDHLQCALEPHGAVARWDGDELTVWLSTQGMFDARRELAEAFGIEQQRGRVISEFIGGGFGAKQGGGFEGTAAAELARLSGRPVRLVNDRHEEQLDGGRRSRTLQTVRLGAKRDGTLTAIEHEAVVDQGENGMNYLLMIVLMPATS